MDEFDDIDFSVKRKELDARMAQMNAAQSQPVADDDIPDFSDALTKLRARPVPQVPLSIPGQIGLAGKAVYKGLNQAFTDVLPQSVGGMIRGKNVPLKDTSWLDKTISEQDADMQRKGLTPQEREQKVFGLKAGTLEGGLKNVGTSAAILLPTVAAQKVGQIGGAFLGGLGGGGSGAATGPAAPVAAPVGAAGGVVAGSLIGGQAAGAATGYLLASRADVNQVLRQKRDQMLALNPNMTEDEWNGVKAQVDSAVDAHGIAEGKWEAVGNALQLALMSLGAKWGVKIPFKPVIAKTMGAVSGAVIDAPLEVASEAATEMDQDVAERSMGLRPAGKSVTFKEAVGAVGPQTLVTTGFTMGLGGAISSMGKNRVEPSPVEPTGDKDIDALIAQARQEQAPPGPPPVPIEQPPTMSTEPGLTGKTPSSGLQTDATKGITPAPSDQPASISPPIGNIQSEIPGGTPNIPAEEPVSQTRGESIPSIGPAVTAPERETDALAAPISAPTEAVTQPVQPVSAPEGIKTGVEGEKAVEGGKVSEKGVQIPDGNPLNKQPVIPASVTPIQDEKEGGGLNKREPAWHTRGQDTSSKATPSTKIDESDVEPGIPQVRTVDIPVSEVIVQDRVKQFKRGADPATGVVKGKELKGKYDRLGTGPIVIWLRNDGVSEVITGRNRFDLAKRTGEATIPAQVVREADGFTQQMAERLDVEANIRDEQGEVEDYAHYFRNSQDLTKDEATQRGLLSRAKGRAGWALGKDAKDDLYNAYRLGTIPEAQAVAIAEAAPGDEQTQSVAIGRAKGKSAEGIKQFIRFYLANAPKYQQMDLMGRDVAGMAEIEDTATAAVEIMGEINSELRRMTEAKRLGKDKNAALLKDTGFKPGDVKKLDARIASLERMADELTRWDTDQQLIAIARERAGLPANLNTAPLIQEKDMPFNLAGEKQVVGGPSEAEIAEAKRIKAEQDAKQGDMFGGAVPSVGIGAAAAQSQGEFIPPAKPSDSDFTGLRKSISTVERESLGLPAYAVDAARRFPDIINEVSAKIDATPTYPVDLHDALKKESRPVTDAEAATLLILKTQRFNERNAAAQETLKAGTQAEKDAANARMVAAQEALESVFDVISQSGTATARGLNAFKMAMDERFQLVEMEQAVRAKQGGKTVTPEQRENLAKIERLYKDGKTELAAAELKAEVDSLKGANDSLQARIAELEADGEVRETVLKEQAQEIFERESASMKPVTVNMARVRKGQAMMDEALAEFNAVFSPAKMSMAAPLNPAALAAVIKFGSGLILKNVGKFGIWRAKMRATFGSKLERENWQDLFDRANEAAGKVFVEGTSVSAADVTDILAKLKTVDATKLDAAKTTTVKSLMNKQIDAGVKTVEEAAQNVSNLVKADFPDITVNDVYKRYSDYGKVSHPSDKPNAKKRAQFRSQSRNLTHLTRLLERKRRLLASLPLDVKEATTEHTGLQRDKPDVRTREIERQVAKLQKEIDIEMVKRGIKPANRDKQIASSMDARKTALRNQIEDIDIHLAKRERMVVNKELLPDDPETVELRKIRDEKKAQYDEMFPDETPPKTKAQRLDDAKKAVMRRKAAIRKQIIGKQRKDDPLGPVQADQELARLREEESMLQGLLDKYLPEGPDPYADARKAKAIESGLLQDLIDIDRQIATGAKDVKEKTTPVTNERIEMLKRMKEARQEVLKEMFPKPPRTSEQVLTTAIKQAANSLERIQKQYQDALEGKVEQPKEKAELPNSDELYALREERDMVKADLKTLLELGDPRLTPEELAVKQKIARDERIAKTLERRAREGDFETRKTRRLDISNSPRALAAVGKLGEARMKFAEAKEQARWSTLTTNQRTFEVLKDIWGGIRDTMSSFDFSAIGRQGWIPMLTRIPQWATAVRTSALASTSAQSERIWQKYKNSLEFRKGWTRYLKMSETDGKGNFSSVDNRYKIKAVDMIPGIRWSNRTYATFLNTIRFELFKSYLKLLPDPMNPTDDELRGISNMVNIFSGSGNIPKGGAQFLSNIMYAPSFTFSQGNLLLGTPMRSKSKAVNKIAAREYGKLLVNTAILIIVLNAAGGDDDKGIVIDPRSSKFGTFKLGHQRVGVLGYMRPMIVFAARLLTGVSVTDAGKKRLYTRLPPWNFEKGVPDKVAWGSGMWPLIGNYMRTKLHPGASGLGMIVSGQDFGGKPIGTMEALGKSMAPLTPRQIAELAGTEEAVKLMALVGLTLAGIDVQPDYSDPVIKRSLDR